MKRSGWLLGFAAILASVTLGAWLLYRRGPERERLFREAQLLDEVVGSVADLYVDSLTRADLYQLAIDGLIGALGDPYAGYFEDEEVVRQNELTSGTYAGIGIRVEAQDGWLMVVSPLTGSPADLAGIQAGDRIVSVDGEAVLGWTPDQSTAALRGELGTVVRVSVARPGVDELLPFTLVRAEIHVNAVRHRQLLDDGIGYVWLEVVSLRSAEDLRASVDSLREQGMTKLVFDLRRNPGGLLQEAVSVTGLFLDKGVPVVETRSRTARESRIFRAPDQVAWPELMVVVLVDEYSASAAEIIAGALQDHDRALVVGRPTFGKGVYQSVFPLGRDEALKFTTGRWYTPLGRSIERDEEAIEADDLDSTAFYVTGGGRRIRGGGGVHPDLLVSVPDSVELALNRTLGAHYQAFRRILSEHAAAAAGAEPSAEEDLAALRNRLADEDVTFTAGEWAAARAGIARQLAYHHARLAGGEQREMALRLADDPLVAVAVERLREVGSTPELLDLDGR